MNQQQTLEHIQAKAPGSLQMPGARPVAADQVAGTLTATGNTMTKLIRRK